MFFAENQEKRQFYRLKFTNPVIYHSLNQLDFGGSVACDISEGGIKINLPQFIPVDTELSLQIEFSKDNVSHCTGRVKWVEELPLVERFRIGIRFDGVESPTDFKKEIDHRIHLAGLDQKTIGLIGLQNI